MTIHSQRQRLVLRPGREYFMKRIAMLGAMVVVIGMTGWTAAHMRAQTAVSTRKAATQLLPGGAVQWVTARPGQDMSVLWGDPRTGAYGRFNRFAAGFEDRPHFHTRDLRAVIIAGTLIVQVADESPVELGTGSYALIPGGTPHTHSCKGGSACVLFVEQDGPNDTTPIQTR
jgi:mannose-6-phosphate isomerase-like protein (cupin superfamily)